MYPHLLLPSIPLLVAASSCKFTLQNQEYDLSSLDSLHTVVQSVDTPPSVTKTTFRINPCASLEQADDKDERCDAGTMICAVVRTVNGDSSVVQKVIPVASKQGDANVLKDGIEVTYNGEKYAEKSQSAVVSFTCSKKDEDPEFSSYDGSVLHLSWKSKAGCAVQKSSEGWGWFLWLIIIAFLGTSAYLILGGWVNYTKYGVTGLDALPHSETMRDLPYLMKDWISHILDTIRGGRGGYTQI
ncbi:Autophagy-related protein 27 [Neolecta irregularis DAH-3]|uniref:Autophagy-related protein 27 n=1 Tax=Neolecta irregularis (strain DAH-3) TaxID=1198029 RepID=A0A1U7LLC8_NEOID|nr:Autophagy-related protein 27 [Neolecta irregularis DAH-3]|eukprot:OLL23449.1 Autophagy-related protein 27 [Neolecta irregularis DAH-3]